MKAVMHMKRQAAYPENVALDITIIPVLEFASRTSVLVRTVPLQNKNYVLYTVDSIAENATKGTIKKAEKLKWTTARVTLASVATETNVDVSMVIRPPSRIVDSTMHTHARKLVAS